MPWQQDRGEQVYRQEGLEDCGLACVAMILNRRDGSRPTARAVAQVSREFNNGAYLAANANKVGWSRERWWGEGAGGDMVRALVRRRHAIEPDDNQVLEMGRAYNTSPEGLPDELVFGMGSGMTGMNILTTLRDGYRIPASIKVAGKKNPHVVSTALDNATSRRPVILALKALKHFVLSFGREAGLANRYQILDPADGRVHSGTLSGHKIDFSSYGPQSVRILISVDG
jgi:hypothetical protein